MIKQLLAIGFTGFQSWLQHAQRRLETHLAKNTSVTSKPKEMIRWEGEGGSLPVTGSQLGPSPKLPGDRTIR